MSCLAPAPVSAHPQLPPVAASADWVLAVEAAWDRVATVAGYRQIIELPDAGTRIETLVLGDHLYHRLPAGVWRKMYFTADGRRAAIEWAASAAAVETAARRDDETIAGIEMTVITYHTAPADGRPVGTDHVIWVGKADGLVHRYAAAGACVTIDYDRLASAPV